MAKTKQQKKEILAELEKNITGSNSLVISVFDKLPVNEDQKLRAELKKAHVKHKVAKKTLLKKVFEASKISGLPEDQLEGNITVSGSEDENTGAKILVKFSEGNQNLKIIGGLLNKVWVDSSKIFELAKLPSKDELIGKTIGTIKAPLSGFVNVLSGNLRGLVNVLSAIKDKK